MEFLTTGSDVFKSRLDRFQEEKVTSHDGKVQRSGIGIQGFSVLPEASAGATVRYRKID